MSVTFVITVLIVKPNNSLNRLIVKWKISGPPSTESFPPTKLFFPFSVVFQLSSARAHEHKIAAEALRHEAAVANAKVMDEEIVSTRAGIESL